MSRSIQRLPAETVDSLRSTVVITSYADAVRELLYNALDAGARSIECVIGIDTAQLMVSDDGRGMAKDVLDRLGTRYLTSQRSHPRTHGYRGEALASLAHLSELSIVSSTADPSIKHRLRLSHTGKREFNTTSAAVITSPSGTIVTIKNLFANIPARRALSTSALTACRKVFQVAALSSPASSMTLWHQDAKGKKHKKCSTRGSSDALAAFTKLFGADLVMNVERINARSHRAAVSGFISLTGSVSSRSQYLFINGHHSLMSDATDAIARKFKQSNFSLALRRAHQYPKSHTSYKTEIQPVFVLDISTSDDVEDGSTEIIALVKAVCDRFLAKHHFTHGLARTADRDSASSQMNKPTPPALPAIPTPALPPLPWSLSEKQNQMGMNRKQWLEDALSSLRTPDIIPLRQTDQAVHQPRILGNSLATPSLKIHINREALRQAIVIGQVSDKFIACLVNLGFDSKSTIVLVDQHAASERVRIERMLRELCRDFLAGTLEKHSPSLALSIRLSPLQEELYGNPTCAALLARWGIEISQISAERPAYTVIKIPKAFAAKLGDKDGQELSALLRDFFEDCAHRIPKAVLEDIANGRISQAQAQVMMPKEMVELANSAACRGAIMFGDVLSSPQCAKLIAELAQAEFPFICAHGRPSMVPIIAVDVVKSRQRTDWML